MTNRCKFWLWYGVTVLGLAAHALAYLCADEALGDKLKDLFAASIAICAASLAAAIQYRVTFLQNLREFYLRDLVPAVQQAIRYTLLSKPAPSDYADALAGISTAIDSIRAVYRNVGDVASNSKHRAGLFPFKPLMSIYNAIEALPPAAFAPASAARAKATIIANWKRASEALFRDFDRVVPIKPVT